MHGSEAVSTLNRSLLLKRSPSFQTMSRLTMTTANELIWLFINDHIRLRFVKIGKNLLLREKTPDETMTVSLARAIIL